ncbi:hypothetical protein [Pedobacter sp. KBW06]|nr:hypothetical protein [Pedobacter sp. KBW06]
MQHCKDLLDHELIVLVKNRDESAFSEVFDRYHSLLFAFSYKKTGG